MASGLKLYEFSALVNYSAVVLAESEEAAKKQVESWERAWHESGEFSEVYDVDLVEVRKPSCDLTHWGDEAHDASTAAMQAIAKAKRESEVSDG